MDEPLFSELMESAREALEHARGKRDLRTTRLPAAPKPMTCQDIRGLRSRLNASQTVFASWLNVSTKLVQAWESGRRTPEGAALRLLRIAERAPELLLTPGSEPNEGARRSSPRRSKSARSGRGAKSRPA